MWSWKKICNSRFALKKCLLKNRQANYCKHGRLKLVFMIFFLVTCITTCNIGGHNEKMSKLWIYTWTLKLSEFWKWSFSLAIWRHMCTVYVQLPWDTDGWMDGLMVGWRRDEYIKNPKALEASVKYHKRDWNINIHT